MDEIQDRYFDRIAEELKIHKLQVMSTVQLLEEGGTVPFIARYRKERTGSLDEVKIATIRDRIEEFKEYDKRKAAIVKSLTERNLLTEELTAKLDATTNMTELEDVYLPFRPKKRTKAQVAKEKGLEPLALTLLEQSPVLEPTEEAKKYISEEKGIKKVEEALQGARDIIAESVSENAEVRAALRDYFALEAVLVSKVIKDKEAEGIKFKDYYDWQEPAGKIAGHRLLAVFRGENEGILKVSIQPDPDKAAKLIYKFFRKGFCPAWEHVKEAIDDAYKRMLSSSIENEYRKQIREKADEEAIKVFASNLRELLMAAPLGEKATLAIDPGFRTGCKVVVLDPQGKMLEHDVIFISQSERALEASGILIKQLIQKYKIQAIAIGNGTASRETEAFIKTLKLPASIAVVVVNESGASIYSASEAAREEFPNLEVEKRSAVSIGRRLQDPLSELVKVPPEGIGVGLYQQNSLK